MNLRHSIPPWDFSHCNTSKIQIEALVHSLLIYKKKEKEVEQRKRPSGVHRREEIIIDCWGILFLCVISLLCVVNVFPASHTFLSQAWLWGQSPWRQALRTVSDRVLSAEREHQLQTKSPPLSFFRLRDLIWLSDPSQSPLRAISALAKCHLSLSSLIQCDAADSPGFLQFFWE